MRRFGLVTALLVAALVVAAGTVRAETPRVKLRLKVPDKGARAMRDVAERAVIEAFRKRHPEIEIIPYVQLRIEGPRGEATVYMSMAGDTAPDALYVYGRSIQKYMDQGFLCPLNDYLEDAPEITGDPIFRKFKPAITREGKVYGVPALVAVAGLLYRKDLYTQAGLDPNRPPKTWAELKRFARKLTIPSKGQHGLGLPAGRNAGWRFPNFVWQSGGEVLRQDPKDGSWRLAFDEPEAIRAAAFMKELRWESWERDGETITGCLTVDANVRQLLLDFNEGRVAMLFISTAGDVGSFLEQGLDPSQIGLAPLPEGPGGAASMLEGEFYGINRLIVHDKPRRDAAWEYIRFITSDEAKRIRTRTYVESGRAMLVNPEWLKKFGYETELRLIPPEWVDLYDRIVEYGKLEPYAPGYDQVQTEVMGKLDGIFFNPDGDPKTVLAEMAHEANTRHFGKTREITIARYRTAAQVIFTLVMAGVFVIVGTSILRWRRTKRAERQLHEQVLLGAETPARMALRRRMELLAWVFMLPAVLTILIWAYYPLVSGARLAFLDYRILLDNVFVGLDNFIEAFTQPTFWNAFIQTAIYAGLSLGLGFLLPIFLALLLSEIPRFKMLFRTVYYLPAITSGLVVMFIWKMMYEGSERGVFNQGLMWTTGTTAGRVLLICLCLAFWAMVLSLFIGIIARIMHHVKPGIWVFGLVLVIVVAPLWADAIREIVSRGPHGSRYLVQGVVNLAGVGTTLGFVAHMLVRGVILLVTVAGVLMLLRARGIPNGRQVLLVGAVLMTLSSAALVMSLNAGLQPMAKPYDWLKDSVGCWAMLWVIVPGIWAAMGPGCIIYLAALKSIPDDLYEAADVDGAGPLEKAYHVTFQYLKPLIIINFVGAFVGTFHAMQNILVMTGGGPGDKTMTIGMDIFFNAFTHLKFGYATAEAWILGSLLIGFTLYQLRILKKLRFTRAES